MRTNQETISTDVLIFRARILNASGQDHQTLCDIHRELEDRYPQVQPVMKSWSYTTRPLGTYTEQLIKAIQSCQNLEEKDDQTY